MAFLPPSRAPETPDLRFIVTAMLGTGLAIGTTAWLSSASGSPWLMAPFGATCVLAFGVPDSPLAQPRSIVGGHVLATLVSLAVLAVFGSGWWAAAIAVAIVLGLMLWTRTVHAPAGANPLVVLSGAPSWDFLVHPVLLGALVIVGCAYAVNNSRARGSYPRYWY